MILKPFLREGVMPLPVTFISTVSREGVRNIAPWSCVMPVLRPLDLICCASALKRDTLVNIRDTHQFVLNLPGVDLADAVIPTAKNLPPEVDEFEVASLKEKPSEMVRPPGIAGCYCWMECELVEEYRQEAYVLFIGKVLRLEVADHVLKADGSLDLQKAKPLMMMGLGKGMHFCTVADIGKFEPYAAMFTNGKDPVAANYEGS
ncbi:MAG: flavin reductase family protein [Desulfomonilaceae bacterium]